MLLGIIQGHEKFSIFSYSADKVPYKDIKAVGGGRRASGIGSIIRFILCLPTNKIQKRFSVIQIQLEAINEAVMLSSFC